MTKLPTLTCCCRFFLPIFLNFRFRICIRSHLTTFLKWVVLSYTLSLINRLADNFILFFYCSSYLEFWGLFSCCDAIILRNEGHLTCWYYFNSFISASPTKYHLKFSLCLVFGCSFLCYIQQSKLLDAIKNVPNTNAVSKSNLSRETHTCRMEISPSCSINSYVPVVLSGVLF